MAFRTLAAAAIAVSGVLDLVGPARAAEPFQVPVIMPLTGSVAFLGQGERLVLQFVQAAINAEGGIDGRPLEFTVKDDQSNPQFSVQLANEIIAGKPAVLLGSSLVASCRAIAPLVENGGPVTYCFSPGIHPDKGSYTFTSSVSTIDLIEAQLRYFRLKGWKRVAIIVSTDATGQDAENGIKEKLALPENKDMSLVAVAHFNTGDLSVAAQIETLKAANPQCLIAWSTGTPIATVFRAIADAGLAVPTATTGGNMTYSQMAQYKAFLPKALYFPSAEWVVRDGASLGPGMAASHAAFYGAFDGAGKKPDISSDLAWDPAMIVVAALRKLGPNATGPAVHDYLEHLDHFAGLDGIFNFEKNPQRGLDVSDAIVTRWDAKAETFAVMTKPGGVPIEP